MASTSPETAPRAARPKRPGSPSAPARPVAASVRLRAVATREDLALARCLVREYGAWLVRHREVTSFDDEILRRGNDKLRAEAAALPGEHAPPRGTILLAFANGACIGCGALRPLDARRAEQKRIFVLPSSRGLGAGRALTESLVATARQLGYDRVILDSLSGMTAAIALYRSLGFREVPAYWDSPYAGSVFLELRLRRP